MNERSQWEPAASNRTCISPGTNRRLFQLSYAGMRAPGLPGSRFRNWCWRQELNPQSLAYEALALPLCYASNRHSASPETSARVGSTGRRSALCRGAPNLKTLSFTQGISRTRTFGRERFSRTRTSSGAGVRRTEIAIFDWCCCGPFRSLCLLWRRVYDPPPVNPVFLAAILVRTAHGSDAENRTPPQTTNANRTTD